MSAKISKLKYSILMMVVQVVCLGMTFVSRIFTATKEPNITKDASGNVIYQTVETQKLPSGKKIKRVKHKMNFGTAGAYNVAATNYNGTTVTTTSGGTTTLSHSF